MSYGPTEDPRRLYETRLSSLGRQVGELPTGSLLAEDLGALKSLGEQFRNGGRSAEDVASFTMKVYWTHYAHLGDDARSNLNRLGFDFGRSANVPVYRLSMHWDCAYEIKDYDYLRNDVESSRLVALGKIASH